MSILLFTLSGDTALWRNPYESMGSFSCLGPAPSALGGLLGAAMGFAGPRTHAAVDPDEKRLKDLEKKGLLWPVSSELLEWEKRVDFHAACRWSAVTYPERISWNVNGIKEFGKPENLRIQQQVIVNPAYEVAVRLEEAEAERVAKALRAPAFPLFLGTAFCRAIVRDIRVEERLPVRKNWAFRSSFAMGEATPLSLHRIDPELDGERVRCEGYWIYPSADTDSGTLEDPFVRGYCTEKEASNA